MTNSRIGTTKVGPAIKRPAATHVGKNKVPTPASKPYPPTKPSPINARRGNRS